MTTAYERLVAETEPQRRRFMARPIVRAVLEQGELSWSLLEPVYKRFLVESFYHVREAAPSYALAGSRVGPEKEPIRQWLIAHAAEEDGHHHWILNDLRALGFDVTSLPRHPTNTKTEVLVAYMYYVAGTRNPVAILGDSFVIEGLSQLFATQVAETMRKSGGLADTAVSYLARHGKADQGHMEDFRDTINKFVTSEEDLRDIVHCANVEFDLFGDILEEVGRGAVLPTFPVDVLASRAAPAPVA